MTFMESMRDLDYIGAAREIGVPVPSDSAWRNLEKAAAAERDVDRAQAIHDLSWALTQGPPERWARLEAIRDAVRQTLEEAYGPRVWEFAEEAEVTREGLIVPSLKAKCDFGRGTGGLLEFFLLHRREIPDPGFVAVFAKCWLQRLAVSHLQEVAPDRQQRGQRTLLGAGEGCKQCDHGLRRDELKRRVEAVREAARRQARQAGSRNDTPPIPAALENRVLGLVGEAVACTACQKTGLDIARVRGDYKLLAGCVAAGVFDPRVGRLDVEKFRKKFGNKYDCSLCQGKVAVAAKCQAALETPLPHQPTKTVRHFMEATDDQGGFKIADMVQVLGEEIVCPACSRWIEFPKNAQDGWVWPLYDGRKEISGWVRLRLRA